MADILVIDDDQSLRRLIVRILSAAGHDVRQAKDGLDGLKLFNEAHPSLLITDIVMPEKEGIELIREVRAAVPSLPILAISGSNSALYSRAATELGATASLGKPFGADELLTVVYDLLSETPPA